MSDLYNKCVKCIDKVYIDWSKCIKLNKTEQRTIEEYEVWGIVHLALYILNFDEYNKLKRYIYDKYGYDVGGATDGQMSIYDYE